jgi:hypothetical protein
MARGRHDGKNKMSGSLRKNARCRRLTGRTCPKGSWSKNCKCIKSRKKSKKRSHKRSKKMPKKTVKKNNSIKKRCEAEKAGLACKNGRWTKDCECTGEIVTHGSLDELMNKAVRLESLAEAKVVLAKQVLEASEARARAAQEDLQKAKDEKKQTEEIIKEANNKRDHHYLDLIARTKNQLHEKEMQLRARVIPDEDVDIDAEMNRP